MGDRESALGFLHEFMRMKYESAMIYEKKAIAGGGRGLGRNIMGTNTEMSGMVMK